MKPKPAPIYIPSVCKVLQLMQASTGHLYWPAEMQRESGLSKPTVSEVFTKLSEAGFVRKHPEPRAFHMDHPPRTFYELTDHGLAAIRLIAPST
jgi:DNA-binding MarR family transcriptional regulator